MSGPWVCTPNPAHLLLFPALRSLEVEVEKEVWVGKGYYRIQELEEGSLEQAHSPEGNQLGRKEPWFPGVKNPEVIS